MLLDSIGAAKRRLTPEDLADINLFCWERMPAAMMRWAWTSRGFVDYKTMASLTNSTEAQIASEAVHAEGTLHKQFLELDVEPKPEVVESNGPDGPLKGERQNVWVMAKEAPLNRWGGGHQFRSALADSMRAASTIEPFGGPSGQKRTHR